MTPPRHLVKIFLHTIMQKSRSATKVDSQFLYGIIPKIGCKNDSHNRENARSTRHTILGDFKVWRVDWLPYN